MKPIPFITEMVKAILDERKTMTRRVVKPQPSGMECHGICTGSTDKQNIGKFGFGEESLVKSFVKPRYSVGDILYVRETWAGRDFVYFYKANEPNANLKWRPSIFMPKVAARIFLRVMDVRVERLQDITEEDASKEMSFDVMQGLCAGFTGDYRTAFQILWDSLNAKRGYGWDTNPWVWVIEFDRQQEGE